MVLRSADPKKAELTVHTDLRSPKVTSLRSTPFAELHVWDSSAHLQMRLEAQVTVLSGPAVSQVWASLSDAAREGYGSLPTPGETIPESLAYSRQPDPACFAVLRLKLLAMDALHLGTQHRRARFERTTSWVGRWLSP